MDDDWEAVHGEPVDLDCCGGWGDATGDPSIDQNWPAMSRGWREWYAKSNQPDSSEVDWQAQSRADRAERQQRRRAAVEQNKAETRARVTQRQRVKSAPKRAKSQRIVTWEDLAAKYGWEAPAPAQSRVDEVAKRSLTELQPGQRGAYFERRTVRPWYWPFRKVYRWQQVSAWQNSTPPRSGVEVVTVGDVSELPGHVRTIGKVGPTGAVEW